MDQENSKSIWPIISTVIVTAIVVAGAMYWWQTLQAQKQMKSTQESQITPTRSIQTPEPSSSATTINVPIDATIIEEGYKFDTPEELASFTNPTKGTIVIDRQSLSNLYGNEERIESFYAPEHPTNKDIIYFSTSTGSSDVSSTNRIYSYNWKTDALEKIYEEHEQRLLRTMGMEGSKLIVMYDGIDNSPGPCFSVWGDWENFGYLELANINAGLTPYRVPQYKVEEGKAEQKKCEQELE